MKMYEKILVTTMGEYMDEIIAHTVDLFRGREAEVICLYVVETKVPFLTPKKVKEMMMKELTSKGKEILADMEKGIKAATDSDVKFRPILAKGDPADEIVKIAEKEEVDVIVMGTGKGLVDKHLLGSVSEKVIHSAPCTVLLVRTV